MSEITLPPFDGSLPLDSASSLSSTWYFSSQVYEAELQNIFSREWIFAGRKQELEEPGSWITTRIGKEAVVISRDSGGVLRAFSNVCRHRAAKICRSPSGQGTRLRCQYHGWTYDLTGALCTVPEFDGVSNFRKDEQSLPAFQVREFGPWIFVRLSKTGTDFDEQWGPFQELSQPFQLEKFKFYKRVEYTLQCNWKVFVDNYLDGGYHVNTLHPALAGVLSYSEYRSEVFSLSSVQSAPLKDKGNKVSTVRKGSAQYWWLYPNLMINLYEGVMDLNIVIPEGPKQCRVLFDFYFHDENKDFVEGSVKVAHQVQLEDQDICEEVQQGLESAFYKSGRFSVAREKTAYHFHQLVSKAVRNP